MRVPIKFAPSARSERAVFEYSTAIASFGRGRAIPSPSCSAGSPARAAPDPATCRPTRALPDVGQPPSAVGRDSHPAPPRRLWAKCHSEIERRAGWKAHATVVACSIGAEPLASRLLSAGRRGRAFSAEVRSWHRGTHNRGRLCQSRMVAAPRLKLAFPPPASRLPPPASASRLQPHRPALPSSSPDCYTWEQLALVTREC